MRQGYRGRETRREALCLNVEYLDRIEYDSKISRAAGPWEHEESVSAKKVNYKIVMPVYLKTLYLSSERIHALLAPAKVQYCVVVLRYVCQSNK